MRGGKPKSDQWHFDAIKAKSIQQGDCWTWQGWITRNGYGQREFRGKTMRVHRIMYTIANGPVSSDFDVCHSCDNRLCCNPAHLWIGTRKENMEDCMAKGRHDSSKRTHCPRGHEYTPENTRLRPGYEARPTGARECKTCNRMRQRLKAGWPADAAAKMPKTRKGKRPLGIKWKEARLKRPSGAREWLIDLRQAMRSTGQRLSTRKTTTRLRRGWLRRSDCFVDRQSFWIAPKIGMRFATTKN